MAKQQVRPLSSIKHLIRGMLVLLVWVNFRERGCLDCQFNCKRDAEEACGSFAGLSAAPLCTVQCEMSLMFVNVRLCLLTT